MKSTIMTFAEWLMSLKKVFKLVRAMLMHLKITLNKNPHFNPSSEMTNLMILMIL